MKTELLAYGEIISDESWYDDNEKKNVVFPNKFNEALAELKEGDELNVYVNSPGGDVFAAAAMASQIKRARMRGVTVNAYIDGLAASAASFLVMACENVYAYPSSMLMIHKPMSFAFGNALEMRATADTLDQIEESSMMPLYEEKAVADIEDIKDAIAKESWLGAKEMSEMFNVTVLKQEAPNTSDTMAMLKACAKNFKHMPKNLIEQIKEHDESKVEPIDYSSFFDAIKSLRED